MATWRKSTYSQPANDCVELAVLGEDLRGIRDSKNPDGGELHISRAALEALVAGVKAGEFDDLV